jgi:hypothetical protein
MGFLAGVALDLILSQLGKMTASPSRATIPSIPSPISG